MKLTILLPVRNEGLNLKIMLKILSATVEIEHEVLVICDSKEDRSIPVVESARAQYPNVRMVLNEIGPGVLNAIRAGVKAAAGNVILIFAADEVGPVLAIEDMLCLIDQGCEFVSCTRYAHGGRRLGGSVLGGVLSRAANVVFHRVAGSALTDATTGIKMFKKDVFERLGLESRPVGWVAAFEMSIKAQMLGLRLGEVPIISIDRLYGGTSTFKVGPWAREYLRWFLWGIKRVRRQNRPNVAVRVPLSTAGAEAEIEDGAGRVKPSNTPRGFDHDSA